MVKTRRKNRSLADRFWEKTIPVPECGCLLWTGAISSTGYGGFTVETKLVKSAHSVAYELTYGLYDRDKYQVLHRCDVRLCVNPTHLFLGSQQDNVDDMKRKGRKVTRRNYDSPIRDVDRHTAYLIQRLAKETILSHNTIAALFLMDRTKMRHILYGKSWRLDVSA